MEEMKEIMEEIIDNTKENLPKKSKKTFKIKECKVLSYNKSTKDLDINFDGYGIRIHNVQNFDGNTIEVKYKGTIGKQNFVYKL